jgi:hypothetical protein
VAEKRPLPARAVAHAASPAPENQTRGQESIRQSVSGQNGTRRLDGAQIVSRGLSGAAIGDDIEGDLLSFVEAVEAGPFDSADVHEDILAAIIGLDKAEALLTVEPLYSSLRHVTFF